MLKMDRSRLAIVIPAFNEENTIGEIIKLASKYGTTVVINDGSSDNTSQVASSAGAKVINNTLNLGYDKALITGFNYACESNFDFMITIDADGQHIPSDIEKYLNEFKKGKDCIVGIRENPQRIAEYLFSFYTRIVWKIKDPLCGMKGYDLRKFNKFKNHKMQELIGTQYLMIALRGNFDISQLEINQKERKDMPRLGPSLLSNILIFSALLKVIEEDTYYFLRLLRKKKTINDIFK